MSSKECSFVDKELMILNSHLAVMYDRMQERYNSY